MKSGSRRMVRPKIRHLAPLDGCACVWRMSLRRTKSTISHELAQLKSHTGILCFTWNSMSWRVTIRSKYKYRKIPKNSNTGKFAVIVLKFEQSGFTVQYCVKRCWRNGKQCRPWSDCSSRSCLIWVYTVCSDLSVRKLRNITVHYLSITRPNSSLHYSQYQVNTVDDLKPIDEKDHEVYCENRTVLPLAW